VSAAFEFDADHHEEAARWKSVCCATGLKRWLIPRLSVINTAHEGLLASMPKRGLLSLVIDEEHIA
jgi:hypothetical protein